MTLARPALPSIAPRLIHSLGDVFNHEVCVRIPQRLSFDTELLIATVGGGATSVELVAELVQLVETAISYGADGLTKRITIAQIETS